MTRAALKSPVQAGHGLCLLELAVLMLLLGMALVPSSATSAIALALSESGMTYPNHRSFRFDESPFYMNMTLSPEQVREHDMMLQSSSLLGLVHRLEFHSHLELNVLVFGGSITCGGGCLSPERLNGRAPQLKDLWWREPESLVPNAFCHESTSNNFETFLKCPWSSRLFHWLTHRFPQHKIRLYNYGKAGADVNFASRVYDKLSPNITRNSFVILDSAVNDRGLDTREALQHSLEYFIRLVLRREKSTPILFLEGIAMVATKTFKPWMYEQYSYAAYTNVTNHYGQTTFDFTRALQPLLKNLSPSRYDDVCGLQIHPTWVGHELFTQILIRFLDHAIARAVQAHRSQPVPTSDLTISSTPSLPLSLPPPLYLPVDLADRDACVVMFASMFDIYSAGALKPAPEDEDYGNISCVRGNFKHTTEHKKPGLMATKLSSCVAFAIPPCSKEQTTYVNVGIMHSYEKTGCGVISVVSKQNVVVTQQYFDAQWKEHFSLSHGVTLSFPSLQEQFSVLVRVVQCRREHHSNTIINGNSRRDVVASKKELKGKNTNNFHEKKVKIMSIVVM